SVMGRKSSIGRRQYDTPRTGPKSSGRDWGPGCCGPPPTLCTVAGSRAAERFERRPSLTFEPDDISRREFVSRTAMTVAGVALGSGAAQAQSGPAAGSRVLGANDRVVLASVGIRGQGNALKRGF